MRKYLRTLVIFLYLGFPTVTHAQLLPGGGVVPVIDEAAILKLIDQIGNQLEQIRFLKSQLENMLLNTAPLGIGGYWDILTVLSQIQAALQQGQSIAYPLQNALTLYRTTYPGYYIPEVWEEAYKESVTTQMDTQAGTLALLTRMSQEVAVDQERLLGLAEASAAAPGRLAAIQAGNNINIEQIQQSIRLREVIMADANARLIQAAYEANEEASRVATQVEFIKNVGVPWRSDMSGGIGFLPYPQ